MNKKYYVYIIASKRNGTLYVGVTSNLIRRVWEHRNDYVDGFTKKYNVKNLVYYEEYHDPQSAIKREKRLKKYNRKWKLAMIERHNFEWKGLYFDLVDPGFPVQPGNDRFFVENYIFPGFQSRNHAKKAGLLTINEKTL